MFLCKKKTNIRDRIKTENQRNYIFQNIQSFRVSLFNITEAEQPKSVKYESNIFFSFLSSVETVSWRRIWLVVCQIITLLNVDQLLDNFDQPDKILFCFTSQKAHLQGQRKFKNNSPLNSLHIHISRVQLLTY